MTACTPTSFSRAVRLGVTALVILGAAALTACSSDTEASTPAISSPGRQVIVVVDFSGSRAAAELETSKAMIGGLTRRLEAGDQMVVLPVAGVQDGRKTSPATLHTVPVVAAGQKREARRQDAAREDILTDVNALFARSADMSRASTDLLSTMFQVQEYAREAGDRRVNVILLSDMVQDAGGMDFTRAGSVPSSEWVVKRQEKQLVPSLRGACVTVVGADSSTEAGVARRSFWQAYFAAAGAELDVDRYRLTLTQLNGALCG